MSPSTALRLVLLLSTIAVTSVADAQPRQASTEEMRSKVVQRIRALRQWKLTTELELNEQQASKLFPILNKYDGRQMKLAKAGHDLRRKLKGLIAQTPPVDAGINKLIDQLAAHRKAVYDLEEERFREVRKVLTPAQAAKAMVVMPELDRRIRRQVRRAIGDARGGGGAGRGPRDGSGRRPGGRGN